MEISAENYINTTLEDIQTKEFNIILNLINNKTENLFNLILLLENNLTNVNEKKRNRSTLLLALLINNLTITLTSSQIHHFIIFFNSRLNDYPSIIPSLIAIKSIIEKYGKDIDKKYRDYNDIFQAIFRELEVNTLPQSMRQRVYEVIEALLIHFKNMENFMESTDFYNASVVKTMNFPNSMKNQLTCEDIVEGILNSLKGEKDPRCLLQCFQIITYMSEVFHSTILESKLSEDIPSTTTTSPIKKQTQVLLTSLPEKIFEILTCYYPITFHPPQNDPYNITHDLLVNTLMNAMISHSSYIPYIIPLLMDHIREPSEEESLYHSFKYLYNLSMKYNLPNSVCIILPDICPTIYNLISTSTRANSLSLTNQHQSLNNQDKNKEMSLNDAAVIEAEYFLQYLFRTYSERVLLNNESLNNELKKFTEHIITQILNEINTMITKHEIILQSPLMPLNTRSIQSSMRTIYLAKLISTSCENGIDIIQNSLLPLLTSHISTILSNQMNGNLMMINSSSSIQENYLIHLLTIFNLIICSSSFPFKSGTYQTELEELFHTISQYLCHKCQYSKQLENHESSNINDLKLNIELYGKLLSTFAEIIIRIPSVTYFSGLRIEILESIIRLITSNSLIIDKSLSSSLTMNIRSSSLLFLSTLLNYEPLNSALLYDSLNNGCIQYLITIINNSHVNDNENEIQTLQKTFNIMANLISSSSTTNGLTLLQSTLSSSLMSYALNSDNIDNSKKTCFALEAISTLLSKDQPQLHQESFIQFLIQSKDNNNNNDDNDKSPLISIINQILSPSSKILTLNEEEWILNLLCTIIERIFLVNINVSNTLLPEILSICGNSLINQQNNNNNNNILSSIVSILYSTFLHCNSRLDANQPETDSINLMNNNTWETILSTLLKLSLDSSLVSTITSIKSSWIIGLIIYKNLIIDVEKFLSSILFDTLNKFQSDPIVSSHLLLWTCRSLLLSHNKLIFPLSQLQSLHNIILPYLNNSLDSESLFSWKSLESQSISWLNIYLLVISTILLPQNLKNQESNQFILSLMIDILYSNQPMSYLNSLFSISSRYNLTPPTWIYTNENKLKIFQTMLSYQNNNNNNNQQENYYIPINLVLQILPTISQSSQILLLLTVLGLSTEILSYYPHDIQLYQDFFRLCLHGLMLNSSSNILSSTFSSSSSSLSTSSSTTTIIDLIYFELRLRSLICTYQLILLTSHSSNEITSIISPHLSSLVPILLQITQTEHHSYNGSALIRSISLQCLELIIQRESSTSSLLLPYSLLHPLQSQVINKLGIVLDDNKRAIRILAANVRNKWIALKR